ncbi:general substrate transporter [Infundibulicybe gibba]|nr:general substrate transporter [Infundibulicybe gibba]
MRGQSFTTYGWSVCLWILIIPFQYGYHISVLNQIQAVLTCEQSSDLPYHLSLPTCIPMSKFIFATITAIFTVGGLMGSLVANLVMDRWGRKGATRISALLISAGAGIMGISSSVASLGFGRFLVGIGSGLGLCVGPIFLAEIAPTKISGSVGVLTQLGIVLGIMITQALGLRFATPTEWRIVLAFSCVLSASQFIVATFIVESPTWLANRARLEEKKVASHRLWGSAVSDANSQDVEAPLLDEVEARREEVHIAAVTVPQLLAAPDLRKPLVIVSLAMASQQLSGINAVLYYSNDILSASLPNMGPYVSLGITVVNVLMTFPPIILIERMGRKQLLTLSTLGALVSLSAVGLGLNTGFVTLSSLAIITFVMSFAVGLGPIPFVMIPEVSPAHAVSALSSVALSLNWIINFFVGLAFLPLRDFLGGGEATKEGRVFYVFATVLFVTTFALGRLYRGRV